MDIKRFALGMVAVWMFTSAFAEGENMMPPDYMPPPMSGQQDDRPAPVDQNGNLVINPSGGQSYAFPDDMQPAPSAPVEAPPVMPSPPATDSTQLAVPPAGN